MEHPTTFDQMFELATGGNKPYAYQRRIPSEGLPDLLNVPTGAGKTAALVLGWLYRRRFHTSPAVRKQTPRWLVYVLPMRVLVEQVQEVTQQWLSALGIGDDVNVYRVLGGEGKVESGWRERPEDDAIFIGTLDMVTSRQLNRGYGEGRRAWPIDFGLFNNGCHFVYDEVQLMGPALPTSRQLHGLRDKLGAAMPSSATWMSATIDPSTLETIDAPASTYQIAVQEEDHRGDLAVRLEARRRVEELVTPTDRTADLARSLSSRHRPGTLTLAIFNTVDRARSVFKEMGKLKPDAELVLLHSRFRPADREAAVHRALAPIDSQGPGRIVVSTQVVEAGVDISAALLVTEAAPWPSIVQRAGRCNRDGLVDEATIVWMEPPKPLPYELADIEASVAELRDLEGKEMTSDDLGGRSVRTTPVIHPVLRRVDVIGLFDTLPDLSGNDIDVSRFIRDSDDLDAEVAWRDIDLSPGVETLTPVAPERCPVPVVELRKFIKGGKKVWRFDHLREEWVRCGERDVRPGIVLIIPTKEGGYTDSVGWDPRSSSTVSLVTGPGPDPTESYEGLSGDHLSFGTGRWISLEQHLEDVEREVRALATALNPSGLNGDHLEAAAMAGRLHDMGKAHDSFQKMLLETEVNGSGGAMGEGPWAKSARGRGPRNKRRYFRHELVSALALLDAGQAVLEGVKEADLVRYLVASHHGVVRLGFRPMPNEQPLPDGKLVALGVHDQETVGPIRIPGGEIPESMMRLSVMGLGTSADGPSWSRRMLALRDREDLGPFRLAFLEALVRLADWRASASYQEVTNA